VKKILTLNLIGLFVLALICPGQSYAASWPNPNPSQNHVLAVQNQNLIPVVKAAQVSVVKSIGQADNSELSVTFGQSCQLKPQLSGSMLQETQVINLNLPANCFSLSISQPARFSVALTVQPLHNSWQKIIPPVSQVAYLSPVYSAAPSGRNTPLTQTVGFSGPGSFQDQKAALSTRLIAQKKAVKLAITLGLFEVLRC
jgi:hypothetical protein